MEYLNNFAPSSIGLDEIQSSKEFSRSMLWDTFFELKKHHSDIKGVELTFDPDKIVLEAPEVYVEFRNYEDAPVRKKFSAGVLPYFTAGEMFFNLLKFEDELNGAPNFFKRIEFLEEIEENGKTIPVYKAHF